MFRHCRRRTRTQCLSFVSCTPYPIAGAPEEQDKQHYKALADVYSFAISMYECLVWGSAFPNSEFKCPWNVTEFIMAGHRPPKPDAMNDDVYALIDTSLGMKAASRPSLLFFFLTPSLSADRRTPPDPF